MLLRTSSAYPSSIPLLRIPPFLSSLLLLLLLASTGPELVGGVQQGGLDARLPGAVARVGHHHVLRLGQDQVQVVRRVDGAAAGWERERRGG